MERMYSCFDNHVTNFLQYHDYRGEHEWHSTHISCVYVWTALCIHTKCTSTFGPDDDWKILSKRQQVISEHKQSIPGHFSPPTWPGYMVAKDSTLVPLISNPTFFSLETTYFQSIHAFNAPCISPSLSKLWHEN